MTKIPAIGSRIQVWNGNAQHTTGGLHKSDLMRNKHGRIVSKKKHNTEKKAQRLVKAGYGTQKGKFGYVLIGSRKNKGKKNRGSMTLKHYSHRRKRRGGNGTNYALSPTEVSGMRGTSAENPSTSVQFAAGMGN